MDDIVKQLRRASKTRTNGGQAWADYEDAADEIERLRASETKTAAVIEGLKLNFAALVLAIEMK